MQGIFVRDRRPASKQAVKDALASWPASVYIEATSLHGGEYSGRADEYNGAKPVHFAGPDPHRDRRFYGTITRNKAGELTVK